MSLQDIMKGPDGPIDLLEFLEPEAYYRAQAGVTQGFLPQDTFLRLDSLGDGTVDPRDASGASLRWSTLLELARFAEAPEGLSPQTRNIFFGEAPRAMLTWAPARDAKLLHTAYDKPYVTRLDLVDVIRERRIDEGKTIKVVPKDRRWRPAEEVEQSQCMRIAHSLWSTIAQRIMPEWLEPDALEYFYRAHKRGSNIDIGEDRYEMRRGIVGAIALKITHIKEIYDESLEQGVAGIGPVGKQDLRTLLVDEYEELHL